VLSTYILELFKFRVLKHLQAFIPSLTEEIFPPVKNKPLYGWG
jgi:hypothetical protein